MHFAISVKVIKQFQFNLSTELDIPAQFLLN